MNSFVLLHIASGTARSPDLWYNGGIGFMVPFSFSFDCRAHSTSQRNKRKSAVDQEKFVTGSRHHIGTDEWTWAPFWRLISLAKYCEKFQ